MARNAVQKGDRITYANATKLDLGALVVVGALVGVVVSVERDVNANGDYEHEVDTSGSVWELPKGGATAFAFGDPVYRAAGGELTAVDTDTKIGFATAASDAGTATVKVRLVRVA